MVLLSRRSIRAAAARTHRYQDSIRTVQGQPARAESVNALSRKTKSVLSRAPPLRLVLAGIRHHRRVCSKPGTRSGSNCYLRSQLEPEPPPRESRSWLLQCLMSRYARYCDLPVELCEHIILSAARSWAIDDKRSLAQLCRVSREIHARVHPILVETVIITSENVYHLRPAWHTFSKTRTLIIQTDDYFEHRDDLEFEESLSAFTNIQHFSGPFSMLKDRLPASCRLTRFVEHRVQLSYPGTMIPRLADVTHLYTRTAPGGTVANEGWPTLSVSHLIVALETHDLGGSTRAFYTGSIVPWALSLPKLVRICFRLHRGPLAEQFQRELETIAVNTQEPRLCVDMQPERAFTHDVHTVFDDANWLSGVQLYVPS